MALDGRVILGGTGAALAAVAVPLYFSTIDKPADDAAKTPVARVEVKAAGKDAATPPARPRKLAVAAKVSPDGAADSGSGNPLYAFSRALSDSCPLDFIGAGRDIGEALGLIAPARHNGGKFADAIRNAQLADRANMPLYKKLMQRSCLLSKLFGDGSCAKN